jgi:DNA-binding transcriptional ArsR family regulator
MPTGRRTHQPDAYSHYEEGLDRLLTRITRDDPHYRQVLIYQQRLIENITQSRQYGDTDTRKAERSEIVDRLNDFALSTLKMSFDELCILPKSTSRQEPDASSLEKEAQLRILEYLSDTDNTPLEGLTEAELNKHLDLQPRQIRQALLALSGKGYVEVTQLSGKWGQAKLYRLTGTGINAAQSSAPVTAIHGDVIIANVGDHAQNIIVGKNINATNMSTETEDRDDATEQK